MSRRDHKEGQILLGNDIVDLRFLGKRAKGLEERYLKKICTPSELECIHRSADPVSCLASHWAIKEAAYKAWVREMGKRYFAPKHFEVLSLGERKVKVPNHTYSFVLDSGPHWIHAMCGKNVELSQVDFQIVRLIGNKTEQSKTLKAAALKYVSIHFSLPIHALHFSICSLNIPQIYCKLNGAFFALSLSHDGKLGAFAVWKA